MRVYLIKVKPKTMEIIQGRTYEAKKPRPVVWGFDRLFNDRQVVHIGSFEVQYDSPTVKFGQSFKKMKKEDFIKWAGRDVTEEMPKGDWRPYQNK